MPDEFLRLHYIDIIDFPEFLVEIEGKLFELFFFFPLKVAPPLTALLWEDPAKEVMYLNIGNLSLKIQFENLIKFYLSFPIEEKSSNS